MKISKTVFYRTKIAYLLETQLWGFKRLAFSVFFATDGHPIHCVTLRKNSLSVSFLFVEPCFITRCNFIHGVVAITSCEIADSKTYIKEPILWMSPVLEFRKENGDTFLPSFPVSPEQFNWSYT